MKSEDIERMKQEAQIHAQEARTQRATVHEIYQIISGGKGEPGDWNGAEPVRRYVADANARIEQLTRALEAAKPYVEKVHNQLWRTEFTAGGPAALAVAEVADVVDAALSSTGTAEQGQEQS